LDTNGNKPFEPQKSFVSILCPDFDLDTRVFDKSLSNRQLRLETALFPRFQRLVYGKKSEIYSLPNTAAQGGKTTDDD
jgi:hypothetical protein